MQFGVLGPLVVRSANGVVDLGWPKQRALLAALLLRANRVVPVSDLVDAVWGEAPPSSAGNAVQKYVSALRRVLGDGRLVTRSPGYLLVVGEGELDLLRFEGLVAQRRWRDALGLWRGEPCEGVELGAAWSGLLQGLRDRRADVRGYVIDERLAAGEHEALIPELHDLVAAEPLCERFWAQLMRALRADGRTAEALAVYARARSVLVDELGVEPGSELRGLHSAMLLGEDEPDDVDLVRGAWVTQCQLPLDVGDFVGRDDVVDWASRSLTGSGVPVVAVSGSPGVGKTALAVRVGHRLRAQFPDGQWFVRLDGASDAPRDPATVLANLLQSSGVDGTAIPDGLDARAAALRARLADRRVLLVLDDAASSEQVSPLLPGIAGSAVLVTSRSELTGLSALHGADGHLLDTLEPDDSVALLHRILRPEQVDAEPDTITELAGLCGHLPLALRIAAANLASRPNRSVSHYVAELRKNRLAKLSVHGDERAAVRAAFDLSYRTLDADAQRLFRLLGLVPGHDFTAPAAAALLDTDIGTTEALLRCLAVANLIQEKAADRYQFHDLLRIYAAERADAYDPEPDRVGALNRLFSWYIRMADTAADLLYPLTIRLARDAREESFPGCESATAWLKLEEGNLVAAACRASDLGVPSTAWRLADALRGHFWREARVVVWASTAEAGLAAARELRAERAQGMMLANLGGLKWYRGDHRAAVELFRQAIQIQRAGEYDSELHASLKNLGSVLTELGQLSEACDCLAEALAISQQLDDPVQVAMKLTTLGIAHWYAGNYTAALDCFDGATDCGSRQMAALALNNRVQVYLELGEVRRAREYSMSLSETHGDVAIRPRISAMEAMARVYLASGDLSSAIDQVDQVLDLVDRTGGGGSINEIGGLNTRGFIRARMADWSEAVESHSSALRLARKSACVREEVTALIGLAACDRELGRDADGIDRLLRAVGLARKAGYLPLEAHGRRELARSYLELGRVSEVVEYAEEAAAIYGRTGQEHLRGEALELLRKGNAARERAAAAR